MEKSQSISLDLYINFFSTIKERIRDARYKALKAVNKEQIRLYWDIGKMITEKQEALGWGKSVVEQLSKDLQNEFSGIKGFSVQNLWYMRKFYMEYCNNEKLQPLVGEISWTHNILIMSKCKDDLEREFYIRMTKKYGWTKNILIHQIEGNAYALYLTGQTNFEKTLPEKYRSQAILSLKDEYKFDFLNLSDQYSERELELALINNIRQFLIEMGGDYCFVGNQYPLPVSDNNKNPYSIDLLLYHRGLQCLVAIDLKIGDFKPEHAGKMQFYLSVLNDKVKKDNENPAIGIVVCKTKNRTIVEYALQSSTQPIGVATYTLTNHLPDNWKGLLPTPEQIAESLKIIG